MASGPPTVPSPKASARSHTTLIRSPPLPYSESSSFSASGQPPRTGLPSASSGASRKGFPGAHGGILGEQALFGMKEGRSDSRFPYHAAGAWFLRSPRAARAGGIRRREAGPRGGSDLETGALLGSSTAREREREEGGGEEGEAHRGLAYTPKGGHERGLGRLEGSYPAG